MQQDNTNSEEIKQSYFQIKSSAVEHLRDLVHDLKSNKNLDLQDKIKELEEELENLKNTKKYWLVWDNEKEPEQVVLDCQNKLPILKEKKDKKILNDDSWESNILIEWDNYHALQVLSYTHKEAIDVIYIDPPYNTWSTDWKYNNNYVLQEDEFRHSKWLNMMSKRLELAYDLLKEDWIICLTIDDYELPTIRLLMDEIFWENNHLGTVIIRNNPKWRMTQRKISLTHEYAIFFWKTEKSMIKKLPVNPEDKSHNYILDNDWSWYLPINLRKQWVDSNAVNKKWELLERYYPIYFDSKTWEISVDKKFDIEIFPIDSSWQKRIWRRWKEAINDMYNKGDLSVKKTKDWFQLYFKFRWWLDWEMPKSIWVDSEFSASEYWTKELDNILWEREKFQYPKSPYAVKKCILAWSDSKDSLVLDFFAWSWTTWHAVLDLNKEDSWNRKFILCTNNENNICEEITYERIKRVSNWYTNSKWNEIAWLWGNLRYYETDFVEVDNLTDIDDEKKLELTYNAWELLAIKEWIYNELEKNSYWQIFENRTDIVAVYFKETATNIDEMEERLAQIQKQKWWKVIWYIYWNPYKKETFKKIKNLELKDIPDPILKVYREINKV